ncbi:MAG TPA: Spy/CpxP family protein refolding chaperone [Candidatus Binatia bacterium]|nr:Spy/CpxP family protein refolding chaperone [Candidatus Binatia bacterium]
MKSISLRLFVAALAVTLGTAIANSQTADESAPPPMHHAGFGGPGMGFFAKYLNLTPDQRAQMKAIMQKEHPTMHPLMQQMHQMEQQVKQYEEGTFDQAKVQALVAAQSQTLVQIKVEEAKIHSEMWQVLTADQQAKYKQFEANREARMQQHMQNEGSEESPAPPQE